MVEHGSNHQTLNRSPQRNERLETRTHRLSDVRLLVVFVLELSDLLEHLVEHASFGFEAVNKFLDLVSPAVSIRLEIIHLVASDRCDFSHDTGHFLCSLLSILLLALGVRVCNSLKVRRELTSKVVL